MLPKVEIKLLGHLQVVVDGANVDVTADRQRHVLALLALLRSVSVAHLVRALWPVPPSTAQNGVQVTISRLRGMLGQDAVSTLGQTYRLHEDVQVDQEQFWRLVETDTPDAWQQLLAITPRRVLDDLWHDPDVLAFARKVERRRLVAALHLASDHLANDRPLEAFDLAEQELIHHPDDARIIELCHEARHRLERVARDRKG